MDMELIRDFAKKYDDGIHNSETTLARVCLEAYEQGFKDGREEAQEQFNQTQMLMMFTAGNA
jgi:flagellar biosynthesis/type III secretory pathway protein FliH